MKLTREYLEYGMRLALKEAELAFQKDEVPVGAVILYNQKIISKSHNLVETLKDATAHAEMLALTSAMEKLATKYLPECTMFVTLEPCIMCAGAISLARLGTIVFGPYDEKKGFSNCNCNILHPKTKVISGVLENECKLLLQNFFQKKRK